MRRNYIVFLVAMSLGILGVAALVYTGYASVPNHKYCMVMDDNFETFNTTRWMREMETGGFGNKEFEWTTDSSNNSFVQDGTLYIVPTLTADSIGEAAITNGYTLNLTATGQCTATNKTDASCAVASNSSLNTMIPPIQSARLSTRMSTSIRYGRVEVRARMPTGDWLWPAIWMLPRDNKYGGWPRSGEIDIAESKGNAVTSRTDENVNTIRSTLHWGPTEDTDQWWRTTGIKQMWRDYWNKGFNTFGLEWDEERIWTWQGSRVNTILEYKFDKPLYQKAGLGSVSSNGTFISDPWSGSRSPKVAPFDEEFYLILNVAVGGTNGFFKDADYPDKPWSNRGLNPMLDFWNNREQWLPTWPTDPKKRGMAIDSVKMWQQC